MNSEFDEGALILQEKIPVKEHETYGGLAVKLSGRMALVALNMAEMLQYASTIPSSEQDENLARYFEKPETYDTLIQWKRMPAEKIVSLINACNPWNQGADSFLNQRPIKIVSARIKQHEQTQEEPGKIIQLAEDDPMHVACLNGEVLEVSILNNEYGIFPGHFLIHQQIRVGQAFES